MTGWLGAGCRGCACPGWNRVLSAWRAAAPWRVRRIDRLINADTTVSAAANRAQLATAVTDAGRTDFADRAGIYFTAQSSYEQLIVNANTQGSPPRSSSTAMPTPTN
jgi:hypothetical protein